MRFPKFILLLIALGLTACSTIGSALNPYEDHFMCEGSRNYGKCASVKKAYEESLKEKKIQQVKKKEVKKTSINAYDILSGEERHEYHEEVVIQKGAESNINNTKSSADCKNCTGSIEQALEGNKVEEKTRSVKDMYRDSLYKEITGLLKEPKTPIVVPPRVMRVLMLPYQDNDSHLYMTRYIYFFVTNPSWVLDQEAVK